METKNLDYIHHEIVEKKDKDIAELVERLRKREETYANYVEKAKEEKRAMDELNKELQQQLKACRDAAGMKELKEFMTDMERDMECIDHMKRE